MWTISTHNGDFQNNELKNIIKEMIEYYGDRNEDADIIQSIYFYDKKGQEKNLSSKKIIQIQNLVDREVIDWRKNIGEYLTHIQEERFSFYADQLD